MWQRNRAAEIQQKRELENFKQSLTTKADRYLKQPSDAEVTILLTVNICSWQAPPLWKLALLTATRVSTRSPASAI
jgi:hypothetical protein